MDTVTVCPVCGHIEEAENQSKNQYCSNCWRPNIGGKILTNEEGVELEKRRRFVKKRRLLAYWSLSIFFLFAVGSWVAFDNIGTTRFLPPPVSDISSIPKPGDWPMYQRDPGHSAFVSDLGSNPVGRVKWQFETGGPIFSSPAVVDGRVFLTTGDRRILALDGDSGEMVWEYAVGGPVNTSPAVAGDLVISGLRSSIIVALNRHTGEVEWEFLANNPVFSSPIVLDGILYVDSSEGALYALDAMTADVRWSYPVNGWLSAAPAVNSEVAVVTSGEGTLHVVDILTGKQRLDLLTSAVRGAVAMDEDLVYFGDGRGLVAALDWEKKIYPFERTARWIRFHLFLLGFAREAPPIKGLVWAVRQPGHSFVGAPAVRDEHVYMASESGTLFAFDRLTGDLVWTFEAGAKIRGSPSATSDTVFIGDLEGNLHAIDVTTGKSMWRLKVDGPISSTPVLANGMLYLATLDGRLYAIQ